MDIWLVYVSPSKSFVLSGLLYCGEVNTWLAFPIKFPVTSAPPDKEVFGTWVQQFVVASNIILVGGVAEFIVTPLTWVTKFSTNEVSLRSHIETGVLCWHYTEEVLRVSRRGRLDSDDRGRHHQLWTGQHLSHESDRLFKHCPCFSRSLSVCANVILQRSLRVSRLS